MENSDENRTRLHITLSERTLEHVEEWQKLNNLSNRSRAIEGLILMSMKETQILGISEIIQDTIRQTMGNQFNRFAKLIAATALEAGAAKEATQHIYWWVLLQEFQAYYEDLERNESPNLKDFDSQFSVNTDTQEGKILMAFFNKRKKRFRRRAVKQLRSPIEELMELLEDDAEDEK